MMMKKPITQAPRTPHGLLPLLRRTPPFLKYIPIPTTELIRIKIAPKIPIALEVLTAGADVVLAAFFEAIYYILYSMIRIYKYL
jgi:hypothetical protein